MSTEKRKYNAKIAAKGLDNTGVTEDHARAMASRLGQETLIIATMRHHKTTVDEDGNTTLTLTLSNVEPVPASLDERVREFQRALYRQRPEQAGQEALRGVTDGTSPEQALDDLSATVERDDDGQPTGVWDGDFDGPLNGPTGDDLPPAEEGGEHVHPGTGEPSEGIEVPADGTAAALDTTGDDERCPAPGCTLAAHDGGAHVLTSVKPSQRAQFGRG